MRLLIMEFSNFQSNIVHELHKETLLFVAVWFIQLLYNFSKRFSVLFRKIYMLNLYTWFIYYMCLYVIFALKKTKTLTEN